MATIHETILQAAREWIKDVMGWDDATGATKVIPAERGASKGPRPPLPFLEVALTTTSSIFGTDEVGKADGTKRTQGDRYGVLTVRGFGLETSDWITSLEMNPPGRNDVFSVIPIGDLIPIDEFIGTSIEARYGRDFQIFYRAIEDARPAGPAATSVETTVTTPDGVSEDLVVDWS